MASAVNLLQLSPTMTEGTVVKWLVKEGDKVSNGQAIAEIETDKAVMEQESFEDGTVLKINVKEGDRVPVESLLMVIGEKGEDISSFTGGASEKKEEKKEAKSEKKESAKETKTEKKEEKVAASASSSKSEKVEVSSSSNGRVLASPLARKMASDAGVELDSISGSGPGGRIIKRDIETAIQEGPKAPASAPSYEAMEEAESVSVSGMRATIARRLTESKQTVPHFQLTVEVRGEKLTQTAAGLKERFPDDKITVTHLIIKAMASTLMKHPQVRTQWLGNNKMQRLNGAHISVAVAIDEGLLTPVIRNVERKGLAQIAGELRDLAAKARERKLTSEDMSGGVQTISNLGMFGIHDFTAIINPPESTILAVGGMEDRPVVENGEIKPGKVMKITMSCDHRVVDGAVGARYMADLKAVLEDPMLMLV